MGGFGSGRKSYTTTGCSKETTNHSLPLDVRKLRRWLRPGSTISSRWWSGPDTPENKARGASIGGFCSADAANFDANGNARAVTLIYKHRGEPVEQRVCLEWTPCTYGGFRVWFRCPACARRVAVIYGAGKYFACRHCYRLCYGCQKETSSDRALRKAFKIREKLGDKEGGICHPLPAKPKGMHWETYYRLALTGAEAERASWNFVAKWLDRIETPVKKPRAPKGGAAKR